MWQVRNLDLGGEHRHRDRLEAITDPALFFEVEIFAGYVVDKVYNKNFVDGTSMWPETDDDCQVLITICKYLFGIIDDQVYEDLHRAKKRDPVTTGLPQ